MLLLYLVIWPSSNYTNAFEGSDFKKLLTIPPSIKVTNTNISMVFLTKAEDSDIFDELYTLYIGSKSRRVIR